MRHIRPSHFSVCDNTVGIRFCIKVVEEAADAAASAGSTTPAHPARPGGHCCEGQNLGKYLVGQSSKGNEKKAYAHSNHVPRRMFAPARC